MANTVFRSNGLAVSQSGKARQVFILTHGGWKELSAKKSWTGRQIGDGMTTTPHDTTLFFYAEDETTTKGGSAFREVAARADDAFTGLAAQCALSDQQLQDGFGANWNKVKQDFLAAAVEMVERKGGNSAVKDYALYIDDRPSASQTWEKHLSGGYSDDVDLLIVEEKKHKRHLSDVFKLCSMAPDGDKYKVYHFGACRVNRG